MKQEKNRNSISNFIDTKQIAKRNKKKEQKEKEQKKKEQKKNIIQDGHFEGMKNHTETSQYAEDCFFFQISNSANACLQYSPKRYSAYGTLFSNEALKLIKKAKQSCVNNPVLYDEYKDFEKLVIDEYEKTKSSIQDYKPDQKEDFENEIVFKKFIDKWINDARESSAGAIKIVLNAHGNKNKTFAQNRNFSGPLIYLLNRIAEDEKLRNKNIEIVNKACYAAHIFPGKQQIDLVKKLEKFSNKIKSFNKNVNIVYTCNCSDKHIHVNHSASNCSIFFNNAINKYSIFDHKTGLFTPISNELEKFYSNVDNINSYFEYKRGQASFRKEFAYLSEVKKKLSKDEKNKEEISKIDEVLKTHDRNKIADFTNRHYKDGGEYIKNTKISKTKLLDKINAMKFHEYETKYRSYRAFFPDEIVQKMDEAKKRKNELMFPYKELESSKEEEKEKKENEFISNKEKEQHKMLYPNELKPMKINSKSVDKALKIKKGFVYRRNKAFYSEGIAKTMDNKNELKPMKINNKSADKALKKGFVYKRPKIQYIK